MSEFSHQTPADGLTCMSCWDDIDSTSYVEYRASSSSAWKGAGFCETCITYLMKSQWDIYTNSLAKTTCKAEQRRLLERSVACFTLFCFWRLNSFFCFWMNFSGPPINLKDATALECPGGGEVHSLWYMSDGQEHSAKLDGSLVGEEREKYWSEQKSFYITDEKEEYSTEGERGGEGGGAKAETV